MKTKKRVHAKKLVEWAKDKPEVLVLSADLTSNTEVDLFRDAYPDRFLSMGMTDDFEIAIAEGSTILRLGRILFGARNR